MQAAATGWFAVARQQAREHPLLSVTLAAAVFATLVLLTLGLMRSTAASMNVYAFALMGGTVGFAGTAAGSVPALFLRRLNSRSQDTMLGFAAGMMLAASVFSLLIPGVAAGTRLYSDRLAGIVPVLAGVALGTLFMIALERFTPHEHEKVGPCGPAHHNYRRLWLFIFAIAIHNLPEGMAIGVGFAEADLRIGVPLSLAIGIQDFPEGLAVAFALMAAGAKPGKAVLLGSLTGLLEPIGALLGVTLASGMPVAYPTGLGFAAGAMLFVVSHEVIPETHKNGHQTPATVGLMVGFAVMMLLDTVLV